ncbi:hypothetical protein OG21DRAFT_910156 [Imleria badia]|nr:hypothetical protein OG21DRAFT_910156 [Imleria badia]
MLMCRSFTTWTSALFINLISDCIWLGKPEMCTFQIDVLRLNNRGNALTQRTCQCNWVNQGASWRRILMQYPIELLLECKPSVQVRNAQETTTFFANAVDTGPAP